MERKIKEPDIKGTVSKKVIADAVRRVTEARKNKEKSQDPKQQKEDLQIIIKALCAEYRLLLNKNEGLCINEDITDNDKKIGYMRIVVEAGE